MLKLKILNSIKNGISEQLNFMIGSTITFYLLPKTKSNFKIRIDGFNGVISFFLPISFSASVVSTFSWLKHETFAVFDFVFIGHPIGGFFLMFNLISSAYVVKSIIHSIYEWFYPTSVTDIIILKQVVHDQLSVLLPEILKKNDKLIDFKPYLDQALEGNSGNKFKALVYEVLKDENIFIQADLKRDPNNATICEMVSYLELADDSNERRINNIESCVSSLTDNCRRIDQDLDTYREDCAAQAKTINKLYNNVLALETKVKVR